MICHECGKWADEIDRVGGLEVAVCVNEDCKRVALLQVKLSLPNVDIATDIHHTKEKLIR